MYTYSTPDNNQKSDPEDLFPMHVGLSLVGKDGLNKSKVSTTPHTCTITKVVFWKFATVECPKPLRNPSTSPALFNLVIQLPSGFRA